MSDLPDPLQGFEFLLGWPAVLVHGIEIAKDELGRLQQSAGCLDFPDFSKSTSAQALDQLVAPKWAWKFFLADQTNRHLGNRQFERVYPRRNISVCGRMNNESSTISLAQSRTFGKDELLGEPIPGQSEKSAIKRFFLTAT
jgi:hypothetical protein